MSELSKVEMSASAPFWEFGCCHFDGHGGDEREPNRLHVFGAAGQRPITARAAAELMSITPRQTYRLLRRYRDGGGSAVANQRRGRCLDAIHDHAQLNLCSFRHYLMVTLRSLEIFSDTRYQLVPCRETPSRTSSCTQGSPGAVPAFRPAEKPGFGRRTQPPTA